jgi:hypothetical protein
MIGKVLLLLATLEGAWELESYRLQGKDVPATGVMILSEGQFAMVYTMNQGRSGRGHGGRYRIEGDRITFDIPWWIQHVPGEPQVMDAARTAGAAVERKENSLTLRFDSGSVQTYRKLPARNGDSLEGAWLLDSYEGSARTGPATGMAIFRDGHFALLYTMKPEGGLDGRSHGGTFAIQEPSARAQGAARRSEPASGGEPASEERARTDESSESRSEKPRGWGPGALIEDGNVNLGVRWEIVSVSGEAKVAEKAYQRPTGFSVAEERLTLDYGKGAKQTFHRVR